MSIQWYENDNDFLGYGEEVASYDSELDAFEAILDMSAPEARKEPLFDVNLSQLAR